MALCAPLRSSTPPVSPPAKTPCFNSSNLRTPCVLILRPSSPKAPIRSSNLSSGRRSTTAFAIPLRATPPQKLYVYPDPIPEFAVAETEKFRAELLKKLAKERETFGDDLTTVVDVCAEIFSEFLHKEYGGPGTLLVEPFTDMLVALKERKLPGAPSAARAALLWAQNYVDQDWEFWNSEPMK